MNPENSPIYGGGWRYKMPRVGSNEVGETSLKSITVARGQIERTKKLLELQPLIVKRLEREQARATISAKRRLSVKRRGNDAS